MRPFKYIYIFRMSMKKEETKIELLSPAGSFEGFLAALSGGADAIYLAGREFGARAYAQNFDSEELIKAIDIAHLYSRKVYLTVNTLIKDKEVEALYEFIKPLYIAGLDGVIVQDLGVVKMFREFFPALSVHASTQMCVCSAEGVKYLKAQGVKRVIPARELSLAELKAIKDETGVEVECFVHGSMCYSYSGQCLMSSFLGGRSGNRGRCAGPCRQPYSVLDENRNEVAPEQYILSMKDMCTLQYIPEMIEAGIDSFKIEGRMKDPSYTYVVTSIYRKYIDKYLQTGNKVLKVERSDFEMLTGSYLRNEVQTGYMFKHNGPELLTLTKGGYNGDRAQVEIPNIKKTELSGKCTLVKGGAAKLSITVPWKNRSVTIEVKGEICQEAVNAPVSAEDIKKQIMKTGDTPFEFKYLEIVMDEPVFISVKAIKELRRAGINKVQEMLLSGYARRFNSANAYQAKPFQENVEAPKTSLSALCETKDQLMAVYERQNSIDTVYIESDLFIADDFVMPKFRAGIKKYVALPYIFRLNSVRMITRVLNGCDLESVSGFLVRNTDELNFVKENYPDMEIISDYNFYSFNSYAIESFVEAGIKMSCRPLELSHHEMKEFAFMEELVIYGHMPMMISAGCIRKNTAECIGDGRHMNYLKDRMGAKFPVVETCEFCYNRILNSVPTSLHADISYVRELSPACLRLQFSVETAKETKDIIDFYESLLRDERKPLPFGEFTRGHFKKSAL